MPSIPGPLVNFASRYSYQSFAVTLGLLGQSGIDGIFELS